MFGVCPLPGGETLETQAHSASSFRHLLAVVDPVWSKRTDEEREDWVAFYARTARAIARQYAASFRDPCHDAADLMQEIRLKLLTKFRPHDAPHRLLTERPCVRNLMDWKGLDLVDYENAEKRSARRRVPLPEEDLALPDRHLPRPDREAELADTERAFRREIREPEDRRVDLLFKAGRTPQEIAELTGRSLRDVQRLKTSLSRRLAEWLLAV